MTQRRETHVLTLDQIRSAQANDLSGISAVLEAMSSRMDKLASRTAGRLATNPARYSDYAQDFRQDAAVSLFEHLPRWTGDNVDAFMAFAYSSIEADLSQRLYAERNPGVDRDALSVFKAMVAEAKGDLALAEQLAQTVPPKGRRLSADRASAARISWQGTTSLDAREGEEPATVSEDVANWLRDQIGDEVRPKVGHGAALEALKVLNRYASVSVGRMTPRSFAANLPTLVTELEKVVRVPREGEARRYVMDAMAILRSAVSTASESELDEDLRSVADINGDQRAERIGRVRSVLGGMTGRVHAQAEALRFSYGIDGYPTYGADDLDGLARAMGTTYDGANKLRGRAHTTFRARYEEVAA